MTLDEALTWAETSKGLSGYDPRDAVAVQVLAAEVRKHQWVSVAERLPELDVPVWLYDPDIDQAFIGCRADDGDGWLWGSCCGDFWRGKDNKWHTDTCDTDDYKITRWMPLPEPLA